MKISVSSIKNFIASKRLFYGVVTLLAVSATWIALSGRYPMAFDENYHFGIIKAYANQWSPFFAHPPANSESFGDITRYPSYLFHYVMSFAYRFSGIFTSNDMARLIFLRLLNVAMLTSSLFIFREIFKKIKVGPTAANLALLFFVLTPVVPFLGGHVNYDNILIPLTALVILLAIKIFERLKQGHFDAVLVMQLLLVCLVSSLVKYTFLPVFAAVGLAGLYALYRTHRNKKLELVKDTKNSIGNLSIPARALLIAGLALSLALFIERYGINIVKYHTPSPDCNQVLSVESCLNYGPWARDYKLTQAKAGPPSWGPVRYTGHWTAQSMHELFFAIDQNYYEQSPLPMPYYAAWIFGSIGLLLLLINWRKIRRLPHVHFVIFVTLFYAGVLWFDNYHRFTLVNWPVAIHGRYMLALLPLVYALLAYAYRVSFASSSKARSVGAWLMIIAIICMLQGGLITYVVRSSGDWYWHNQIVISVNNAARSILSPIIPR